MTPIKGGLPRVHVLVPHSHASPWIGWCPGLTLCLLPKFSLGLRVGQPPLLLRAPVTCYTCTWLSHAPSPHSNSHQPVSTSPLPNAHHCEQGHHHPDRLLGEKPHSVSMAPPCPHIQKLVTSPSHSPPATPLQEPPLFPSCPRSPLPLSHPVLKGLLRYFY